jgi:protein phosphatase
VTHQTVGPQGILLVVADGLGGHDNGEIASHVAVEALAQSLFHQDQHSISVDQQLCNAIQETHSIITRHITSAPDNHAMSSTLTAVHIGYSEIIVAQVGDSRAYMLSNGTLTQLTEDQTFVYMMQKKV